MLSHFSHVWLFATLWTVAHQIPQSMGFSGQEYWSGLPCPPPGDLPDPGIEPTSPVSLLGRRILNHWTTREVPSSAFLIMRALPSPGLPVLGNLMTINWNQRGHIFPRCLFNILVGENEGSDFEKDFLSFSQPGSYPLKPYCQGGGRKGLSAETLETGPRVRKQNLNPHLFFPQ